jgi:hypothetical protein
MAALDLRIGPGPANGEPVFRVGQTLLGKVGLDFGGPIIETAVGENNASCGDSVKHSSKDNKDAAVDGTPLPNLNGGIELSRPADLIGIVLVDWPLTRGNVGRRFESLLRL